MSEAHFSRQTVEFYTIRKVCARSLGSAQRPSRCGRGAYKEKSIIVSSFSQNLIAEKYSEKTSRNQ